MQIFHSILIGVDLTQCRPLRLSGLNPVALAPIHEGIQLAKANAARIVFFSATNLNADALPALDSDDHALMHNTFAQAGSKVLQELVQQAKQEGVAAQFKIVPGKGWLEIIHEVLRAEHDLVVVGTRQHTGLQQFLFGSTTLKLLRRCPCPVLVTRAGSDSAPLNMLIATDLKPSSDEALRLGIDLAHQVGAHVYILHVVEQNLDDVCHIGLPDAKQEEFRRKVRDHAEAGLHRQLDKMDYKSLGSRVQVHIAEGVSADIPDVAIQRFIKAHRIQLLVMGTIARGGIRGIMIGNTAERLLPEIECSVLAVKPPDFVCPVER